MSTTILFYEKNNYGNPAYYVVGENAGHIQSLTGRKTITKSDITALKSLGFDLLQTESPSVANGNPATRSFRNLPSDSLNRMIKYKRTEERDARIEWKARFDHEWPTIAVIEGREIAI